MDIEDIMNIEDTMGSEGTMGMIGRESGGVATSQVFWARRDESHVRREAASGRRLFIYLSSKYNRMNADIRG